VATAVDATAAEALLRELDEAATNHRFPTWLHAHLTVGAMRATGLACGDQLGLVFETLSYDRREQLVRVSAFAFGPALARRGIVVPIDEVVPASEIVEEVGELEVRSKLTGERLIFDAGGRSRAVPPPRIPEEITLRMRGRKRTLALSLPEGATSKSGKKFAQARLRPEEVVLFQLADTTPMDELFTPWKRLSAAVGAGKGARVVFTTEAWEHPEPTEAPSKSKGIRALVRALAEGVSPPAARKPNSHYRDWLVDLLKDRTVEDERRWATAAANPRGSEPKPEPKPRATAKGIKLAAPPWLETRLHPSFGNESFPCAAIRARGFSSPAGPALVLQAVVWSPGIGAITGETYAYGPGAAQAKPIGFVARGPLIPAAELRTLLTKGGGPRRGQRVEVVLGKARAAVELTPPSVPRVELLSPGEVLLYALVDAFPRDVLLPKDGLVDRVGLDRAAVERFVFDSFQQAPLARSLAASPDLVAMGRALDDDSPLEKLPGRPDTDYRIWLGRGVRKRPPSPLTWASL